MRTRAVIPSSEYSAETLVDCIWSVHFRGTVSIGGWLMHEKFYCHCYSGDSWINHVHFTPTWWMGILIFANRFHDEASYSQQIKLNIWHFGRWFQEIGTIGPSIKIHLEACETWAAVVAMPLEVEASMRCFISFQSRGNHQIGGRQTRWTMRFSNYVKLTD